MKTISLSDREHEILHGFLTDKIEEFKSAAALDPFYVTEIVNFFHKVETPGEPEHQPLVPDKPEVLHGAPDDQRPKEETAEITLKTKSTPEVTEPVTPDNIDKMEDALLPSDSLDDDINIEKPHRKK